MYDTRIHEKSVIMIGTTTRRELCSKRYIIYRSGSRDDSSVFINTDFYRTEGGFFLCCSHYGRKLCGSEATLRSMTIDQLESSAYNAWMDGAR